LAAALKKGFEFISMRVINIFFINKEEGIREKDSAVDFIG